MTIAKHGRYWKVAVTEGAFICMSIHTRRAGSLGRLQQALDDAPLMESL